MKALLHLLFLLIFPCFVFGDNENNVYESIKGSVFTSDGYPTANVSVLIKNTAKGTITDDNGNFELEKIKPGTCILLISLLGYTEKEMPVEVKEDQTTILKIQLQCTYAELKRVIVESHARKYVETKTSQSLHLDLPLIEVPQNIAVVTNQLLTDQGLVSMTEAIRNVSGVTKYYGTLNDYSLMIRGMNATYSVFRNGVGGYWWNQQEDVAMLEKIEFVKGPAGFIISIAEPGGIVNNVTKQPTKERIASIGGGFGSFNLMRLTADFGGALIKSGKLSYRLNAGAERQERAFQFGKAKKYFVCPVLKYEFNKKTSVTAEYNYMYGKTSGNNDGVPGVNDKMFVLPRDFAVSDPATDAITAIDYYYRLYFQHDFNESWHLNVQLASVHGPWGGDRFFSDFDIPVSHDTLYRTSTYEHYNNYAHPAYAFIEGKFRTGREVEHNALSGIDYNDMGSTGSAGGTWGEKKFAINIFNPNYYVNPDSLRNFEINPTDPFSIKWIALYVQDHIKIAGKLVVTLGGHLTHASTNFEREDERRTMYNVFTPRAGLTWLFGDDISVYALYDQCFFAQGGRSFEHKTFKPLTGFNIEAGLKSYYFNKKLNINLSIFNIERNNSITGDPLHPGYDISRGQTVSKGLDFDMTGYVTNALIVNANYEYSVARVTKDTDPNVAGGSVFNTPDHLANLWLNYKLQNKKLKGTSVGVGNQYSSKRRATNDWEEDKTKFLPGYYLLDAAVSYSNDRFNIGLNIYNITNANYASIGYFSQTGGWRYTRGEPINFRLSFGVNLLRIKNKQHHSG